MASTGLDKAARYRAKNADKLREKYRQWAAENPEKAAAATARWRANNPEKVLATQRAYRAKHREKVRAQKRITDAGYKKRHPEKVKEHDYIRRARKYGVGYERFNPREIHLRDGFVCHLCGNHVPEGERSLDHLIPLGKGGTHSRANVALAHVSCNVRRGTKNAPAQLLLIG